MTPTIAELAEMINRLIDQRARLGTSPAPELEQVAGIVTDVSLTTRSYAALLEGAKKPTTGIPYPSGTVPVVGDQVIVLRQRSDGWLLGGWVLGRDFDLSAYPKVIAKGVLTIPRLSAPGVSTAQLVVQTGLAYAPGFDAYYSNAGAAQKVPATLFNAAGQILAVIDVSTQAAGTGTQITAQAQTSLAAGGGPWTISWAINDRQAI